MSDEWMDLKAKHEQAVEAVKELRKKLRVDEMRKVEKPVFTDKPPLGCKPAYISSPERIVELSKAITRQAEDTCNEQLIRRWATEILYHCEILEKC